MVVLICYQRCRFCELICCFTGPPEEYESGLVDESMPGPGLACVLLV
jgi:hypothetical protein